MQGTPSASTPLTERRYIVPFVLVTSLFFLWALGVNLNDILIPHPYTKLGSSLLVMSIIGEAICPAIMGYISDLSSIRAAFAVPLICYAYVFYFATSGYRPAALAQPA